MCKGCNLEIPINRQRRHAIFCSKKCSRDFDRRLWKENNPNRCMPGRTSNTGAAHELLVSADLMLKGYEVFRALSPDCPCDLAILKEGRLLRVQVTTGYRNLKGKVTWPPKDPSKHDLLAVVISGDITYSPEIF